MSGTSEAGDITSVERAFLDQARQQLAANHRKIRHCLDELDDALVWWRSKVSMNSIGTLVLHLCGNLDQGIGAVIEGQPDHRGPPGSSPSAARSPGSNSSLAWSRQSPD